MMRPAPSITVTPHPGRVRVILAGTVVADSTRALALREGRSPPVLYVPRADARLDAYVRTTRSSHCPYKGDASYYDLVVGTKRRADAVWSYEAPLPEVAPIAGHLAFYPDQVDAIETEPA